MCPAGHAISQSELRYDGGLAICPLCRPIQFQNPMHQGPQPTQVPKHLAGHWRFMLSGGILVGLALVVIGFVLAFIPLPTQDFAGSTGWCGPGTTSESAVFVRLDPNSVNDGDSSLQPQPSSSVTQGQIDQAKAEFKSYCTGIADTRLEQASVLTLPGLILGVGAVALLRSKPRWLLDS
jgi:hypothetical protein